MRLKMQIELNAKEHNARNDLAETELRDMRQQARKLVHEGLQQKGKLEVDVENQTTNNPSRPTA
jgi:hypothetical protein